MAADSNPQPKKMHFKCMNARCKREWDDYPGSLAQIKPIKKTNWLGQTWYETGCPKCRSDYFEWTDYGK